jgi:UDP-N-acetylglucosamine--N-acetylmuramyl-(pentapeptide) pyrophosphoryl-undecaprenol N-acetylglucosamine transferase
MGGSQGASGVNDLIVNAIPALARHALPWQWLHLAGPNDVEKVQRAYARHKMKAVVRPFLSEMELALAAATASVSRAGASSLAELAALRLPALLVPFPAAADNHQWHNARAFEETGAAQLLEQLQATPEKVSQALRELMEDTEERKAIRTALARWHVPKAAQLVADKILQSISHAAIAPELPATDESRSAPARNRGLSEDILVA